MARMELRARVDGALENTIIEMWMDGKPLGHVILDAATLEGHIHDLAKHRAQMKDEVPRVLDPGSRLEATVDPVWKTTDENPPGGKVLALRDPGLGWLAFFFPHNEAVAIAEWLTKDQGKSA